MLINQGPRTTEQSRKIPQRYAYILSLCLFCSLLYVTYNYVTLWGIAHDVAVLSYDGWLMLQGMRPYSDFLEYNTPISIFIYALQITIFGLTDTGWLVSLACWFLLSSASVYYFFSTSKFITKFLASLILIILEISGGHWIVGQRDFMAGIFALLGSAVIIKIANRVCLKGFNQTNTYFVAGIMFGIAIGIRPHLIAIPIITLICLRSFIPILRSEMIFFVIGLLAPWGTCLLYLYSIGSLKNYLDLVFYFQLSEYVELGKVSISSLVSTLTTRLSPLLLIFIFPHRMRIKHDVQFVCLISGFIGALISYCLQFKGWGYQASSTLPYFACISALIVTNTSLSPKHFFPYSLTILFLGFYYSPMVYLNRIKLAPYSINVAKNIIEDLKEYDLNKMSIQPLDLTDGVLNALLHLQKKPATKFLYDVYFYNGKSNTYLENLRSEFLRTIEKNPPSIFIMSSQSWPNRSLRYDRLNKFLPLRLFLESNYRLCKMNNSYWIYVLDEFADSKNCKNVRTEHRIFYKNVLLSTYNHLLLLESEGPNSGTNDTSGTHLSSPQP